MHPRAVIAYAALSASVAWSAVVVAQQVEADRETDPPRVRIAGGGDLLLHIKVNKAAERHGWDHVFGALEPIFSEDEIAFANLETPLVDDVNEVRTGSPPILGAPAEAATALANAGVDVLGCANNHALDQRAVGLARTVTAVEDAGIACIGAGDRETIWTPRVVHRGGLRVAFLSTTQRVNRGPGTREPEAFVACHRTDPERLMTAIDQAREVADVVVLAVHWSHDFAERPSRHQRRLAREWVDRGVDLILGTGPHVLQKIVRTTSPRGDAVIAYSLGNLVSNQGQRWEPGRRVSAAAHTAVRIPDTRDGLVLRTEFTKVDGQLELSRLEGVPLFTVNNYWAWWFERAVGHDIRVIRLADADEDVQQSRLPAIRAAIGDEVSLVFEQTSEAAGSVTAAIETAAIETAPRAAEREPTPANEAE